MTTPTPKPHFDARTAASDEVEPRLLEIGRDARRRGFQQRCDELLAKLRDSKPSAPCFFDAHTARPDEVEARLAQLTGGR